MAATAAGAILNVAGAVWSNTITGSLDPDYTIVERCLSGDAAAWEELVRAHTRRVYGLCYRFTGKDAEAQDLTQDVFLRVFRALGSFRSNRGIVHHMARPADAQSADRPLPAHPQRADHGLDRRTASRD